MTEFWGFLVFGVVLMALEMLSTHQTVRVLRDHEGRLKRIERQERCE